MVTIYTGRLGKAKANQLDITVKSGAGLGKLFAPTWELVGGHKAGAGDKRFSSYIPLTDDQYTERYLKLLRDRYVSIPALFSKVLAHDYTLACYCAAGKFCHRHIVVSQVLPKLAARLGIEYRYGGEI